MVEREELKPCPFCGNEAIKVEKTRLDGEGRYYVYCPRCEARGSEQYCAANAIGAWNDVWNNADISLPELKSCPFCGAEGEFINYDSSVFWVQCVNCGSHGMQSETKRAAINAWNRRADDGR